MVLLLDSPRKMPLAKLSMILLWSSWFLWLPASSERARLAGFDGRDVVPGDHVVGGGPELDAEPFVLPCLVIGDGVARGVQLEMDSDPIPPCFVLRDEAACGGGEGDSAHPVGVGGVLPDGGAAGVHQEDTCKTVGGDVVTLEMAALAALHVDTGIAVVGDGVVLEFYGASASLDKGPVLEVP